MLMTIIQNPCDQARSTKAIVAIAYGKGIVCCEQYEGQMTGQLFASFITEKFDRVFANSANPRGKLFLQDGDPSQNSKVARDAMAKIGTRLFSTPPRIPDLNPIENVFHLINRQLQTYALEHNIVHETYEQFSTRVKNTLENFPVISTIDNIIELVDQRVNSMIKGKGQRLRYYSSFIVKCGYL